MQTQTAFFGKFISPAVFLLLLTACSSGGDSVSVNGDVPIAYVQRPVAAVSNPTDGTNTANGGALMMREQSSPSSPEINLTQTYTLGAGDVSDPEVSYDGTKILFAMRCSAQSSPSCYNYQNQGTYDFTWNIWEYDLSTRQMRRVTTDGRISRLGDDVDPAYLSDGRIVFSSNRQATSCNPQASNNQQPPAIQCAAAGSAPGAVGYRYTDEYEREPVIVLHTMDADGTTIRQISFNQSHDRNPTVMPNGEILYSRWDHVGDRNQFSIFKINPDGTDYFVVYGAHSPGNSYLHPRPMPDGKVITTIMPLSGTREGGSLEIIDVANFSENDIPAEGVSMGSGGQSQVTRQLFPSESNANHNAPRGQGVSPLGRYHAPYPLWDGTNRVLVTFTPSQPVDEANPFVGQRRVEGTPQYGIRMLDLNRNTSLPVVNPQPGVLYTDAVAIQSRPVPAPSPTKPLDIAQTGAGMGVLNVKSVYDTDSRARMAGGTNGVLAAGESIPQSGGRPALGVMKLPTNPEYGTRVARFFRITKAVPTPAFLDRETIGEEEFEMQQIIGYGVIEPDGSMTARVPANTPVAITALDREGRGFIHHTNWIQVREGETRTCNGCHSPRRGSALNAAGNPAGNHPGATSNGHSMAETRYFALPGGSTNTVADLKRDPAYQDFWTTAYNPAATPETPISFSYAGLTTPSPVVASNGATCNDATWTPVNCAIVINYETHIQPIWNNRCVSCHLGAAPSGNLDLSGARNALFNRFNSYQELLVGDPVQPPVVTVDEDGEFRIQRLPALVNAGNARSSTLIERLYEQELKADNGTACISNGVVQADGLMGCANNPAGRYHANLLSAPEKRLVSEWVDIGAQYYNDPFVSPGVVRSAATLLDPAAYRDTIHPILMNLPANGGAGCASCHQAFGGNGTSGNAANPGFSGNRFVLTGNPDGDFNAVASMVTDVCTPANSYLLMRPSRTLADVPPHPGTGLLGVGPAVLPAGPGHYTTILNWVSAAMPTPCP